MTVRNRKTANETTFNDAFLSRKNDTSTVGKLALENTELESGEAIANVQRAINELFDAVGVDGEGDSSSNDYSSNEYVADGDSYKEAIGKLDARAKINSDNISSNTSNIATNTLNIATNTSNIATNTANIAANTANIASNASNISALSSANHGDVTLASVGSTPNANAATLTGQVLSLQPANETYAGIVSTLFQKIAGAKEFQGVIAALSGDSAATGSNQILEHNSKSVLRMTSGSLVSVAGIGNTVAPIANGLLLLVNVTGVTVSILNLDGTAATKGINTGTGANLSLPNNQSLLLWYDAVSSIYRVISGAGGSGGGISNVVTKTASGALTLNDDCVIIDASGGNINLTLPAVVSKAIMRFKRIDSVETNTVTITCAGSDTMDGATTATIPFQYATLVIIGIGTTTWGKF